MMDQEVVAIEKGVPIPTGTRASARYPFATMEIGDSILVPGTSKQLARSHALNFKKTNPGWDYKTRTTNEGMRIWRIS
jgi:hypothetical protein